MTMSCPSCQSNVDQAVHAECPTCGWAFSQAPQMTAIRPATRPKIQVKVELACTVDRTGSSQHFANGIRKGVPMILDQIQAKARGLRVWLQTHGDEDCGQQSVLLTDGDVHASEEKTMLVTTRCRAAAKCCCRDFWHVLAANDSQAVVECHECCLIHVVPRKQVAERLPPDTASLGRCNARTIAIE